MLLEVRNVYVQGPTLGLAISMEERQCHLYMLRL